MKKVKLTDVCEILNGYAFKSNLYKELGLRIIRITNVQKGYIEDSEPKFYNIEMKNQLKNYILNEDDLLISLTGNVGRVGLLPKEMLPAVLNQRVGCIRIKNESLLNKKYLFNMLNNSIFENACINNSKGVAQKNLSTEWLKKYNINLPNIKEQESIANKLDKVQEIIDIRKKQLQKLDELLKSQFVDMFGEPTINQKGFELLTVGDVLEFQGGSQPDKKFFEYKSTPDNIRLIQIRDYKSSDFITYIPKNMAKKFCEKDDIMIGRYGPPIFQILQGIEGSYNVALMKAIPKKGNREFLRYFLKQECLLHYLEGLSQRTAGQAGIDMPKLKKYPLPYPPIELQNKFADIVKQIDKQKLELQKSLEEMQKLQESLMNKYFN